jgi:hypothetical protein
MGLNHSLPGTTLDTIDRLAFLLSATITDANITP